MDQTGCRPPADCRRTLADRIGRIRREAFGEDGVPDIASRIGVPARTWENYETGVTMPGEVILRFTVLTRVEPAWLLTGDGPVYREQPDGLRHDLTRETTRPR